MKIKYKTDDFIVEEIINSDLLTTKPTRIGIFLLEKQNITTFQAIDKIYSYIKKSKPNLNNTSNYLKIHFAGLKDKYSKSVQHISIYSPNLNKIIEELKNFKDKNLKIKFINYSKSKLTLSSIKQNKFTITLRDIDKKEKNYYIENVEKLNKIKLFLNYYDYQRINAKIETIKNKNKLSMKELKLIIKEIMEKKLFQILPNKEKLIISNQTRFFKERENIIEKSLLFNLGLCLELINQLELTNQAESIKQLKGILKNNLLLFPILEEVEDIKVIKNLFEGISTKKSDILENRSYISSISKIEYQEDMDEFHRDRFKITLKFCLNTGSFATIVLKHIIPMKHYSHLSQKFSIIN